MTGLGRMARKMGGALLLGTAAVAGGTAPAVAQTQTARPAGYAALETLFGEWRAFEYSGTRDGAPDYTAAAMAKKAAELKQWQKRLAAIDRSGWSTAQLVDYQIVRAEMNGLDFDLRVLKPWERDPAFYQLLWAAQSDTPAHEGPMAHGEIELWQYKFPLDAAAAKKLTAGLKAIPPFLAQGRSNLTANTRDLWSAGIATMEEQAGELAALEKRAGNREVAKAAADARKATDEFVAWLKAELPKKTGPSGVGIENYNWYLKNVQLSPFTWEGEVALLQRELGRSHAALRLQEHNNRNLPQLAGATDAASYEAQATKAVKDYLSFLGDNEILTVRDYMEPALMAQRGRYVPPEQQNFFHITMHRAPMTLWTHFYHWWDLQMTDKDPHPSLIRRGPLLYNIWISRAEGQATGMEEAMLHAGLFDDRPREKEIVWIMQAQRAARGLASLYAQANIFTMDEAKAMQVSRTPNGWMSPTLKLLAGEQQLYLRQPGYGTSYISGKHQVDKLIGEMAEAKGKDFRLKDFYDGMNKSGMIPMSLIRWEMLGQDDEVKAIGAF